MGLQAVLAGANSYHRISGVDPGGEVAADMTDRSLTRIDPAANMRRFYRLSVQPGLFGDWCLLREWGRIGTSGQGKEEWFESEAEAIEAGNRLDYQKQRRGYQKR